MKAQILFLSLAFLLFSEATSERQILEVILKYRNAMYTLDPFPATRAAQAVQAPVHSPLFQVFNQTRSAFEAFLAKDIPSKLFPGYQDLPLKITMIPNDILGVYPQKTANPTCESLMECVPTSQQVAVKYTLYHWNYLAFKLTHVSQRLLACIKDVPKQVVSKDTIEDRLYVVQGVLGHLFHTGFRDENECLVLLHLIEYLRHFICVQWQQATTKDYYERLWNTWKVLLVKKNKL